MNIAQAKQIPLEEVLMSFGHQPKRHGHGQLWYLSPFRQEKTPSFKVQGSLWYDFGEGQGGDVLDLVMRLERLGSVSAALARLDGLMLSPALAAYDRAKPSKNGQPSTEASVTHVGPVKMPSLLNYLRQRGIDRKRIAPLVKEVHYRRGERSYYAIGFASDSGGIELRSLTFKGTLGSKDLTVISGNSTCVLIFEGFFDFLSFVTLNGQPKATVIVLNSVALKKRAAERLRQLSPRVVKLYRDHDAAGQRLLHYLQDALPRTKILDQSALYPGHKDLNAWHTAVCITQHAAISA